MGHREEMGDVPGNGVGGGGEAKGKNELPCLKSQPPPTQHSSWSHLQTESNRKPQTLVEDSENSALCARFCLHLWEQTASQGACVGTRQEVALRLFR